ncbi:hypothetical protein [Dongia sedimenti]|uniref:Uncharacterized protein n=1 Tax=Dongia sedimenti TaxID=3064282 RepID=A0ABU0YSH4_9PROT|nr:hypothetical protein [Rhodospirillaceae bacterium R-7]
MKTLAIAIIVLSAALVWVTSALVRVENERYALVIGMCRAEASGEYPDLAASECLSKVQTRTTWYWHLASALELL